VEAAVPGLQPLCWSRMGLAAPVGDYRTVYLLSFAAVTVWLP
jgi:hypothetical protein